MPLKNKAALPLHLLMPISRRVIISNYELSVSKFHNHASQSPLVQGMEPTCNLVRLIWITLLYLRAEAQSAHMDIGLLWYSSNVMSTFDN